MTETIKHIYAHLQDRQSKELFANRLLYTLTNDSIYIDQIIASMPQKAELDRAVEFCRAHADQIIFYGTGNDLLLLSRLYPDLPLRRLCDKSEQKQRNGWQGIPVMSPERLREKRTEAYVAITTSGFYNEIESFLLQQGFKPEQIINLSLATDIKNQYFDPEIMTPELEGIFVDGGCFNCSTDREFIKWCQGRYQKIVAFEPDRKNYRRCLEISEKEGIKNIEIINKGLWDCAAELAFEETGGQGSKIGAGGSINRVDAAAIDEVVTGGQVTLIKLDVEGAELKALQGSQKIIRQYRPRLAISVYHKPEDILELPEYVLSLHEDYQLYLRHYQMSAYETILYAL